MRDLKEILIELAAKHDSSIREFRLSGDVSLLCGYFEDAIRATQPCQPSWSDFDNALTDNEKRAFGEIFTEINGDEGNISVVKMLQKTGLSRPVFTSLLQKMEKYNVAVVKNQGVKGTYIKILDKSEML